MVNKVKFMSIGFEKEKCIVEYGYKWVRNIFLKKFLFKFWLCIKG